MAKNWNFTEALEVIKKGKDHEAIADIARRFPVFAVLAAKTVTGDAEALMELVSYLPEYNTVGKVNTRIKEGTKIELSDDDTEDDNAGDDDAEADDEPKTTKAPVKDTKSQIYLS